MTDGSKQTYILKNLRYFAIICVEKYIWLIPNSYITIQNIYHFTLFSFTFTLSSAKKPGERLFLQLQQRKSTLTADRVLPQFAKDHFWPRLVILHSEIVLRRPTEYFRNLRMSFLGRDWSFSVRIKHSNGRQSASAICEGSFLAEIGHSSFGNCTPTADRVLPQQRKTKNLCTYAKNRERMMRNWRKMRIFAALLNIIRCVFR